MAVAGVGAVRMVASRNLPTDERIHGLAVALACVVIIALGIHPLHIVWINLLSATFWGWGGKFMKDLRERQDAKRTATRG